MLTPIIVELNDLVMVDDPNRIGSNGRAALLALRLHLRDAAARCGEEGTTSGVPFLNVG